MLIVFIGPDGCGKTTIAMMVVAHLERKGKPVHFFEMNFGILPRFRDLAAAVLRRPIGRTHVPGELLAGMKHRPNPPVRGAVYMLWYSLDYFLGRLRYNCSGSERAVIFARYAYDYGFQRSYSRVPGFFLKLMLLLAPVPDFVFTIKRNSEDIFAGKPELTVQEIRRQQSAIEALLSDKSYFYVLDGSHGVNATVASVLELIEGSGRS